MTRYHSAPVPAICQSSWYRRPCCLAFILFLAWGCDAEESTRTAAGEGQAPQTAPGSTTAPGQPGSAEACDGLDNDGDTQIDEGVLRSSCSSECGTGVQECVGGMWIGCSAPEASTEICDALDNDCDGRIDETLSRACESDCGDGEETCSQGRWVGCTAPPSNEPEVCDGQDNDCDGTIDENVFRSCTSDCSAGTEQCLNGSWGTCDAQAPAVEECSDGKDNDCDGQIDEGDACACGEDDTESCSTDLGECEAGTRICECSGGEGNRTCSWSRCRDDDGATVTLPGENVEECNAKDDDCNGIIDDILPSSCGSSNVGECSLGQFSCQSGQLFCVGETEIQAELCDGLDNDCDETIDEGLSFDIHEDNDQCQDAKAPERGADDEDASISQETEIPLIISGAELYSPDGSPDEDWFHVVVEESTNFFRDPDYRIKIQLSDYSQDVDYRLCVKFSGEKLLSNACADLESVEVCGEGSTMAMEGEEAGNPVLTVEYDVNTRYGRNDDTHALIRIFSESGTGISCQPYTLTIQSETI